MEKLIHPKDHQSILETCKSIHDWFLKWHQGKLGWLKVSGRVIESNIDESYRIEISVQLGAGWYHNEKAQQLLDMVQARSLEKWSNVKVHGCGYAELGNVPTYGEGMISKKSLIEQMDNPQYVADKGM